MKDTMTYKGYTGSAHYDDDDRISTARSSLSAISSVMRVRMWTHYAPLLKKQWTTISTYANRKTTTRTAVQRQF